MNKSLIERALKLLTHGHPAMCDTQAKMNAISCLEEWLKSHSITTPLQSDLATLTMPKGTERVQERYENVPIKKISARMVKPDRDMVGLLEYINEQISKTSKNCFVDIYENGKFWAYKDIQGKLQASGKADNWRPISEAPKDTLLFLYDDFNGRYIGENGQLPIRDNQKRIVEYQYCWGTSSINPTHWQPLPSPPEQQQEGM